MLKLEDLKKRDGESETQYLWRIGYAIENGLSDMTWDDVTPYINYEWRNGEDEYRTSCAYRKPVQSALRFYNEIFSKTESTSSDEELRLAQLRDSMQNERRKLQIAKTEKLRTDRHDSRFELFYESIKEAFDEIKPPEMFPLRTQDTEKAYLLGLGDIHYGACFKSETNEYSREIAKTRFQILLGGIVAEIEQKNISHLSIVNVGDCVQGILRMTDLKINEVPVVQAVVEISKILAMFLNELSAYVEIDYYHVPCANHTQTRPLGTKASEIATEDLEFIIVNYIRDVLAGNDRVRVHSNLGHDYLDISIFDFKILAVHGHQIKDAGNALAIRSAHRRCLYDYLIMGHYHSGGEKPVGTGDTWDTEVLTCPSMVGSDPYSDTLCASSQPKARLYEFDKIYGHSASKNIFLK